ncbi:MAG: ABC transporter substrate-binding protein [Desulfobacterales bacterium]|jgi:branched-chain amino acid transport system substrate-binding protein
MNREKCFLCLALIAVFTFVIAAPTVFAAEPIVIGVPTSLGFLEGKEAHKAVQIAVSEINAKGGVNVGGTKRLLKVAASDLRDAAPGVPVPEALLGLEKNILEEKPTAIVVGPFRSEALIAGMDIIAKYKVPMVGTIAMSPSSEKKIKEDPEKYKYIFRSCLDSIYLVKYLAGAMALINKQFGFNKVFVMHQDVAWARGGAGAMQKMYFEKAGWEVLGMEAYPTGTADFSSGLMKARAAGAQVIMPIFDMPQSGILVKQWKSMKVPAIMFGFISPLAGSKAWKTFDGKIGGGMNCIFEIGNSIASAKVPKSVSFFNKYQQTFGTPIQSGHGVSPAYESVYLLAEAIERAGSLDPDAIVAELKKTDRMGVIGRTRFNESNQVVYGVNPQQEAVGAVIQWTEDGKRKIVFPDSLATGKIDLPKGLKSMK